MSQFLMTMTTPRKFTGYIIEGKPVTVQEGIKAGIIPDPEREKKRNPVCPNCGSDDIVADGTLCARCDHKVK